MKTEDILGKVKGIVQRADPAARIILFGSHARGDMGLESDWDFLILLSEYSTSTKNQILDDLFDVTLEIGEAIVPLFRTQHDWHNGPIRVTQFYDEVTKEGIAV